jgi:hypothetical protein
LVQYARQGFEAGNRVLVTSFLLLPCLCFSSPSSLAFLQATVPLDIYRSCWFAPFSPQNSISQIPMDPKPERAGLEEVEKLTSDDSYFRPDTGGIHNELRVSNTDTTGQPSAAINGQEKREEVEIVDWDGPDDPENPYARLQHTIEGLAKLTIVLVSTGPPQGNGSSP